MTARSFNSFFAGHAHATWPRLFWRWPRQFWKSTQMCWVASAWYVTWSIIQKTQQDGTISYSLTFEPTHQVWHGFILNQLPVLHEISELDRIGLLVSDSIELWGLLVLDLKGLMVPWHQFHYWWSSLTACWTPPIMIWSGLEAILPLAMALMSHCPALSFRFMHLADSSHH